MFYTTTCFYVKNHDGGPPNTIRSSEIAISCSKVRCAIIANVKIIVVEDEPPIRTFIANALKYCVNREVKTFENGSSAWAYLKDQTDVDIVISDVDMPEMSGIELLQRIKQQFPARICIIMSGNPMNEELALKNGADGFLAKPFKLGNLFEVVQTFVING
ncbi:MAG: response regulator [Pseudomonadota bacterium]